MQIKAVFIIIELHNTNKIHRIKHVAKESIFLESGCKVKWWILQDLADVCDI